MPRGRKTDYLEDPYRDAWFRSELAGHDVRFKIVTDPPEAVFWETHRLKLTNIKILDKTLSADAKKAVRKECFDQIIEREEKPMLDKQKSKRRAKRVDSRT